MVICARYRYCVICRTRMRKVQESDIEFDDDRINWRCRECGQLYFEEDY